ncbi:MAG TPA: hypothetical protein PLF16_01345, partial [Candidatus Staskawiczbacteria bacterium]|nr:hypothetical protein [Candidatus Staskawiczbacteria bacterium]
PYQADLREIVEPPFCCSNIIAMIKSNNILILCGLRSDLYNYSFGEAKMNNYLLFIHNYGTQKSRK